jgi:hypothetical protein
LPSLLLLLFTSSRTPARIHAAINTYLSLLPERSTLLVITDIPLYFIPKEQQLVIPDRGYDNLHQRVFEAFLHVSTELVSATDNTKRDYDWVMKADDDTYVRLPSLLARLKNVNPEEEHYFGHPYGYDLGWKGKQYQSQGHDGFNYCWGGPGYLLSRKLMTSLQPHWKTCITAMSKTNFMPGNKAMSFGGAPEDLLIGSCIYNHTTLDQQGCQLIPGTSLEQVFRHRENWQFREWTALLTGEDQDWAAIHSATPEIMYTLWYLQDSPKEKG